MKSDKRFSSPVQSVLNKTLKGKQRSETGTLSRQYRSANPNRRASAVSYEIGTIHEECLLPIFSDFSRRMSAPELPPISDTRILTTNSNNNTMGNGNEYYKSKSSRFSSDSSQKGIHLRRSPLSANSSHSSNRNAVNRSKTWITPEQTVIAEQVPTAMPENLKLDSIKNRNGVSVHTPRSVSGQRTQRLPSKDMSTSSGNNNSKLARNRMAHCVSEPKIQPIENFMGSKSKPTMKRNASDNKLGQNKRLISIEKTQNLTQNKFNSGNVNGMRRYSSTVQLNNVSRNKNDEYYDDEDTDSESGKDQMIIEWLIGVENEDLETPPDPLIEYAETPIQTDTAIHIVYSESS